MKFKYTYFGFIILLTISLLLYKILSSNQHKSLTAEQLEEYYAVYQQVSVIGLREALNGYLNEDYSLISELAKETNKDGEYISGLDSFDKEYYKSKFIVLSINEYMAGGKYLSIIFQDKPDRLFYAWLYELSDTAYELRTFTSPTTEPSQFIKSLPEKWNKLIEDPKHSI